MAMRSSSEGEYLSRTSLMNFPAYKILFGDFSVPLSILSGPILYRSSGESKVISGMGAPSPCGPWPLGIKYAPRTGGGQAPPAATRDCFNG